MHSNTNTSNRHYDHIGDDTSVEFIDTDTQATPDITPVQAEVDSTPKGEPIIWAIQGGYEDWKFLCTSIEDGISPILDYRITRNHTPQVMYATMHCTRTGYILSINLKEALPLGDYFQPGEVVAFQPNDQLGCTELVVRSISRTAHGTGAETLVYNLELPSDFYNDVDYQEKYIRPRLKAVVEEFRDSLFATDMEE